MEDNDIIFIAKHYRKGKFKVSHGWRRLGIAPAMRWRRIRIAAAVAGVVALTAAAAVVWRQLSEAPRADRQPVEEVAAPAMQAVKAIDFENAPLPTVVAKIKEVYGVDVANVPENAEEYRLSLHYEGNIADLVDVINDLLGTEMEVKQ